MKVRGGRTEVVAGLTIRENKVLIAVVDLGESR